MGTDEDFKALEGAWVEGLGAKTGHVFGCITHVGYSPNDGGDFVPYVDFLVRGRTDYSLTSSGDSGMLWRLQYPRGGWQAGTPIGIHLGGDSTEGDNLKRATTAVGMFIKRAMDTVGASEIEVIIDPPPRG